MSFYVLNWGKLEIDLIEIDFVFIFTIVAFFSFPFILFRYKSFAFPFIFSLSANQVKEIYFYSPPFVWWSLLLSIVVAVGVGVAMQMLKLSQQTTTTTKVEAILMAHEARIFLFCAVFLFLLYMLNRGWKWVKWQIKTGSTKPNQTRKK